MFRLGAARVLKVRLAEVTAEKDGLSVQVRQLEKTIGNLLSMLELPDFLPSEELRLHVGARTSKSNFYAQGSDSTKTVLRVFGADPQGPILDWGCGSGRTYNWLRLFPAWRAQYHGCDVDAEAIAWMKSRGVENVAVCGDEPPLPYDDGAFVNLFGFSVLTHIHPSKHLDWYREIARVLRPGGRAFVTTQGEGAIATGSVIDQQIIDQMKRDGWAYQIHDGHYKDAALVSVDYTMGLMRQVFNRVEQQPGGYHNMEAFVVWK